MAQLTRAHNELFRRTADEQFASLDSLLQHCRQQRSDSLDRWELPQSLIPSVASTRGCLELRMLNEGVYYMNDWSFGQLCRIASVRKDTVNRLSPDTAKRVLYETMPTANKPLQLFTERQGVRSIHPASYTRLHNADVLEVVQEFASDFQPPQPAGADRGPTGLYCGEQDMFAFLIDPAGWTEIDGEAFAPGFFVWNSEVGRRSVGVETFWFQAICANHIVWDATEVVEFTRKHTTNVHDALDQIRRIIQSLIEARDRRRDGFVKVIRSAMETRLGEAPEDVMASLAEHGISKAVAGKALAIARERGQLTIFSVVDALTRLAGQVDYAGDRTEADQSAARLLSLAA